MVDFTATTGNDNPPLSAGDDIVRVTTTGLIQAADTFQGGDGIDTIIIGTKNASVAIDLSLASSDGTAGFLNFEALAFGNTGNGGQSAAVTLSSAQFGTGKISNTLAVSGTAGTNAVQSITVNVVSGGSFSATGWTFTNWSTNTSTDTITINGAAGNETIYGSTRDDLINAGDGADIISAVAGNDTVNAGGGDDLIWSGRGNDVIDGGTGIDTIHYVTSLTPVTVTFSTATAATATNGTFTDTLSNVEGFVLTTGSDTFNGGDGDDIVTGGRGADVLNGGAGADTFIYGAADGADTIDGGTGIDTVKLVSSTIMVLAPTVFANWSNIEIIDASATTLAKIQGTTGADTIDMSAFSQLINVELNGGGGNDTIIGTAGDDLIVGGGGADVLTGNGGADTFVFPTQFQSSALYSDTITDMGADDTIDLSAIDANSGLAGDQAFVWIGTDAFSKTAGELRYDATLGAILGDVTGNGRADLQIFIPNYTPDGTEFLL